MDSVVPSPNPRTVILRVAIEIRGGNSLHIRCRNFCQNEILLKVLADYPILFEDDTRKAEQDYLECYVLLNVFARFNRAINTPDSKRLELKEARGVSSSATHLAILDKRSASAFSTDAQPILLRWV